MIITVTTLTIMLIGVTVTGTTIGILVGTWELTNNSTDTMTTIRSHPKE